METQHSFSAGMQRGRTLDLSGTDTSAPSQDGTFLRNCGGRSETFNAAFGSGLLTEVLTPGTWILGILYCGSAGRTTVKVNNNFLTRGIWGEFLP